MSGNHYTTYPIPATEKHRIYIHQLFEGLLRNSLIITSTFCCKILDRDRGILDTTPLESIRYIAKPALNEM